MIHDPTSPHVTAWLIWYHLTAYQNTSFPALTRTGMYPNDPVDG